MVGRFAEILFLCSLFAVPVAGWWCDGHALTVEVAKRNLCPQAANKTAEYVGILAAAYPKAASMVPAACWADDLKAQDDHGFDTWHYINYPFVRTPVSAGITALNEEHNVVWGINQSISTISAGLAPPMDNAQKLYFLMHFAGDIHQPLHTVTEYSPAHPPPGGDEGGNLYGIKYGNLTELHAFWDSGAGQWLTDIDRPFLRNDTAFITSWADKITSAVPKSSVQHRLDLPDPADWAIESFMLGVKYGYPPQENATLPDSFVTQARSVVMEQVAVGGYRLAIKLNQLFGCGDMTMLD